MQYHSIEILNMSRHDVFRCQALLGENGAGKSTLMNILSGMYRPEAGTITWQGQELQLDSPRAAIDHGIGMVHQDFKLIQKMTVAENIILGQWRSSGFMYRRQVADGMVRDISEQFGLSIQPESRVAELSAGMQQRVEIVRILSQDPGLIILDEPTSVLTPQEVTFLFRMIRSFTQAGKSVCFISHKLEEVMTIADRITVLRDGRVVGTVSRDETSKEELACMMVGREVVFTQPDESQPGADVLLKIQNLRAVDRKKQLCFDDISLDIHAGEIVGIAGISGNGQEELAEVIAGLHPADEGQVQFLGKVITNQAVKKVIASGLAYVPNKVRRNAIFMDFDLEHNAILKSQRTARFSRYGFLRMNAIRNHINELIAQYGIRASGAGMLAKHLSGGNLQKLVLARELTRQPQLILAVNPTAGLDVGAIEYVHEVLLRQRTEGRGVLLISADLEELLRLSDRIAIMYAGRIVGCVKREEANLRNLGLMMGGSMENSKELSTNREVTL